MLQDSLARLIEVKQLQIAMSDPSWNKQESEVIREREKYYEIQENSSKGFLTLSLSILDLMYKLAKEPEYISAFMGINKKGGKKITVRIVHKVVCNVESFL